VARAARPALDQLQRLHNPPHDAAAPGVAQVTVPALGDPQRVTDPRAQAIIQQVNAGDYAGAVAGARALMQAAEAGQLSPEAYIDAVVALSSAQEAANRDAQWTAGDIFVAILWFLLLIVPGIVNLVKQLDVREG